ncbi:MAG: hypothetical protein IJM27_05255 [Eubacterium sp.]|nr:hypothetical protein [Eubacterium sp.]
MSRKKIRRIILAVSLFYMIVAVLAIFMLKDNESVLAKQTMAEILFGKKTEAEKTTASESPDDILGKWTRAAAEHSTEAWAGKTTFSETVTEKWTEAATEWMTEAVKEKVTEMPTEKVTEAATEKVTQAATEKVTEAVTEKVTEMPTEKVTEAATEKKTEEAQKARVVVAPQADGKYYAFDSLNTSQYLLMRESATKQSKAIAQLKAHTTGALIERGDSWSKVAANGKVGYCYTPYIRIREVTREEYEEILTKADIAY